METSGIIYLNVKTVPAFDTETKMPHTAYTVFYPLRDNTAFASAWTLQDAVRLFRRLYNVKEEAVIKLRRPFQPQYSVKPSPADTCSIA
jgi:hypothetical protein